VLVEDCRESHQVIVPATVPLRAWRDERSRDQSSDEVVVGILEGADDLLESEVTPFGDEVERVKAAGECAQAGGDWQATHEEEHTVGSPHSPCQFDGGFVLEVGPVHDQRPGAESVSSGCQARRSSGDLVGGLADRRQLNLRRVQVGLSGCERLQQQLDELNLQLAYLLGIRDDLK